MPRSSGFIISSTKYCTILSTIATRSGEALMHRYLSFLIVKVVLERPFGITWKGVGGVFKVHLVHMMIGKKIRS